MNNDQSIAARSPVLAWAVVHNADMALTKSAVIAQAWSKAGLDVISLAPVVAAAAAPDWLREMEWAVSDYDRAGECQSWCPNCGGCKTGYRDGRAGHKDGCELAAALAAAPAQAVAVPSAADVDTSQRQMESQASAWFAVCAALDRALPGWIDKPSTGKECAIAAIEEMAAAAQKPATQAPAAPWKDHQTARLVNDLRDCALQHHRAGQLRERIAHIVAPLCDLLKVAHTVGASDTARLDWLETRVVNVRTPLPYGSLDLFWANPEEVDGGPNDPSDLRTKVDAARAAQGGAA